jgi:hypothetical protein
VHSDRVAEPNGQAAFPLTKKLATGRYVARLEAIDGAGNPSRPIRKAFIVASAAADAQTALSGGRRS